MPQFKSMNSSREETHQGHPASDFQRVGHLNRFPVLSIVPMQTNATDSSPQPFHSKPAPVRLTARAHLHRLLRKFPAALLVSLISLSYAASYGAMIFGSGGGE